MKFYIIFGLAVLTACCYGKAIKNPTSLEADVKGKLDSIDPETFSQTTTTVLPATIATTTMLTKLEAKLNPSKISKNVLKMNHKSSLEEIEIIPSIRKNIAPGLQMHLDPAPIVPWPQPGNEQQQVKYQQQEIAPAPVAPILQQEAPIENYQPQPELPRPAPQQQPPAPQIYQPQPQPELPLPQPAPQQQQPPMLPQGPSSYEQPAPQPQPLPQQQAPVDTYQPQPAPQPLPQIIPAPQQTPPMLPQGNDYQPQQPQAPELPQQQVSIETLPMIPEAPQQQQFAQDSAPTPILLAPQQQAPVDNYQPQPAPQLLPHQETMPLPENYQPQQLPQPQPEIPQQQQPQVQTYQPQPELPLPQPAAPMPQPQQPLAPQPQQQQPSSFPNQEGYRTRSKITPLASTKKQLHFSAEN